MSTSSGGGGGGGPDLLLVDTESSQIPETPGVVILGNEEGVYAFKLKMHNGTGTVQQLNFTLGASDDATHTGGSPDVGIPSLYVDNEPFGVLGVEDNLVSTVFSAYSGSYYSLSGNLGHVIDTVGENYMVSMSIDNGAGKTVQLALEGSEAGTPGITIAGPEDVQSFDRAEGTALLISNPAVVLTLSDPGVQPVSDTVLPGQGGANGVFVQRVQFSTPGTVSVQNVTVQEIGSAGATDIEWIALYEDIGVVGVLEPGTDNVIGSTSGPTFTLTTTWEVTNTEYMIVAVKVADAAISGNVIKTAISDGGIVVNAPNTTSIPAGLQSNDFTVAGNPQLADGSLPPAQRLGAGLVDVWYQGKDPDFDTVTYVSAEYSLTGGGGWQPMTNAGNIEEDFQNEFFDYPFVWDALKDAPDTEDTVSVKLQVTDGTNNSNIWEDSVTLFIIDTKDPVAASSLAPGAVTTTTVDLSWTAGSDSNFSTYEIWYKACDPCTVTRGMSGETQKLEAAMGATGTQLTGLAAGVTYSINIWAVDIYNNVLAANQITATTTTINSAPQIQPGAAAGSQSTDGTQLVTVTYNGRDAENNTVTYVAADCEYSPDNVSWFDMSTSEATEDFTATFTQYDYVWDLGSDLPNTEDSTVWVRLRVEDSEPLQSVQETSTPFGVDTKDPVAPSVLATGTITTNTINLTWTPGSDTNWSTYEIWYKDCNPCTVTRGTAGESVRSEAMMGTSTYPLSGLASGTTYTINVWAVDAFGNVAPASQIVATTSMPNVAPEIQTGSVSASQSTDGTRQVTILYNGKDANADTVTYVAADCEYSPDNVSWFDMNTLETGENFTNAFTQYDYVWNVNADLTNTEDSTVWVRLKVQDGAALPSLQETSSASFAIDTQNPAAASGLASGTVTPSTIDLSWTAGSDSNFSTYEIWYKACDPCTVTRGTSGESVKYEAAMVTTGTQLTGLSADTTYTINIWAVDTFGSVTAATQITSSTFPSVTDKLTVLEGAEGQISSTSANKTQTDVAMLRWQMQSDNVDNGQIVVNDVKLSFVQGGETGIGNLYLYRDTATIGVHDGETAIGTFLWNAGGYYYLNSFSETVGNATKYLICADLSAGENDSIQLQLNATPGSPAGISIDTTGAGNNFDSINNYLAITGATININGDSLTADAGAGQIGAVAAYPSQTDVELLRFRLVNDGSGDNSVDVTTVSLSHAQGANADLTNVYLYRDTGTPGVHDGESAIGGSFSWTGSAWELSGLTETVSGTVQFLVAADITSGATLGAVQLQLNGTPGSPAGLVVTTTTGDSVANSAITGGTITIDSDTLTADAGAGQIGAWAASPAETDVEMLRFRLVNNGSGDNSVDVTTVSLSHAQGVNADLTNIYLYRDTGTAGIHDGESAIGGSFSWTGSAWELSGLTETVSGTVEYLVAADITSGATLGAVQLQLNGTPGSPAGLVITTTTGDSVANSAVTGGVITIGSDTLTADDAIGQISNNTATQSLSNVELLQFRLVNDGNGDNSVEVTNINLSKVGSWNETNITNLRIYSDTSPIGKLNNADSPLAAGTFSWVTDHWELSGFSETVSGTQNYLVVADISGGATYESVQIQLNATSGSPDGLLITTTTGDSASNAAITGGAITIEETLSEPPLPPCFPDDSPDACGSGAAPPLPPCGPFGSPDACGVPAAAPPLPPCTNDGSPLECRS